MQAVVSSWLNLQKTIFKPENKTMYGMNDHLWHLKFAEYCFLDMKKLCLWGAVNREKGKERTRFCSIIWEFQYFCIASCKNNAIFVGFSLICLEGLGNSEDKLWPRLTINTMYHIKTEDPITDYVILLALEKKNRTPALQKSKQVTHLSASIQYLEIVLRKLQWTLQMICWKLIILCCVMEL